jgi:hypothetical protein
MLTYKFLLYYFQFYIKFSIIYYITKHNRHDYKLVALEYCITEDNTQ